MSCGSTSTTQQNDPVYVQPKAPIDVVDVPILLAEWFEDAPADSLDDSPGAISATADGDGALTVTVQADVSGQRVIPRVSGGTLNREYTVTVVWTTLGGLVGSAEFKIRIQRVFASLPAAS